MAYTFGGVVGSRCSWVTSVTTGASGNSGVFTGWYLPTTLTATRNYWTAGATFGARIAGTTSEIEMRTANATTGGVYTTSGAGIATGTWFYLAWIWSISNTGPVGNWRVYVGTLTTPPTGVTVTTTTSPVGNLTGNTTMTIGNTTANSTAFQGDIGVCSLLSTGSTGATVNPLGIAAATGLTQGEADQVLRSYITPMWLGDVSRAWWGRSGSQSTSFDFNLWEATPLALINRYVSAASFSVAPTLTSSTVSANGNPRPSLNGALMPRIVNKR